MSKLVTNAITLGQSGTAANNFLLDTDAAGALRIRRNADGSGGAVLTVNNDDTLFGEFSTLSPVTATTSGTSHTISNIPSWATAVSVYLRGVSSNGTSDYLLRLNGESSGYNGSSSNQAGSVVTAHTTGFLVTQGVTAASVVNSLIKLEYDGTAWLIQGQTGFNTAANQYGMGYKTTSAALTNLVLTTVNGTDVFDLGSYTIRYRA